jgi:hypothetical protein
MQGRQVHEYEQQASAQAHSSSLTGPLKGDTSPCSRAASGTQCHAAGNSDAVIMTRRVTASCIMQQHHAGYRHK